MCNSQNQKDKTKNKISFMAVQLEQKVKQVENATKLYFQSLVVLAAGIATLVTAIVGLNDKSQILVLFTFGTPSFLISWFGCFLFIYWEHHMLRINLDYTEKMASEALGIPTDEIYLYHEDYLGVFNQANFKVPFTQITVKSVRIVFVTIAFPFFIAIIFSIYKAKDHFENIGWYWFYIIVIFIAIMILLCIHIQCIRREGKLKKKLGIKYKSEIYSIP